MGVRTEPSWPRRSAVRVTSSCVDYWAATREITEGALTQAPSHRRGSSSVLAASTQYVCGASCGNACSNASKPARVVHGMQLL